MLRVSTATSRILKSPNFVHRPAALYSAATLDPHEQIKDADKPMSQQMNPSFYKVI